MNEADIQREVMMELSRLGAVVWRNNTGSYKDGNRYIRYGLCAGSSDLIGIYRGTFIAVEVKTPKGRVSEAQKNFLNVVNANGGIGFVARRKEDVKKHLTYAL